MNMERFWNKVNKSDRCWNWTGSVSTNGYARFGVGGKNLIAHRWLYFQLHPEADRSLDVCHTCDNPRCVRPDHLWLGTTQENVDDSVRKGRAMGGNLKGEQHGMHKLSEDDVKYIRSSATTPRLLSEQFVVHISSIHMIQRRATWRHI